MKKIFFVLLLTLCIGCSGVQIRRVFFGLSKNDAQTIDSKISQIVTIAPGDCYNSILDIFKQMGVCVLKQDEKNRFIVGSNFKNEPPTTASTEVGILIEEIEAGKCKVSVFSESRTLAEYAAKNIFEKLKK
ncbi:MAG: hypothetical protein WCI77_00085 [Candidatus Omnitrophota bacterium]